ncbi:unnamed protein product, partial [Brenthis ino]
MCINYIKLFELFSSFCFCRFIFTNVNLKYLGYLLYEYWQLYNKFGWHSASLVPSSSTSLVLFVFGVLVHCSIFTHCKQDLRQPTDLLLTMPVDKKLLPVKAHFLFFNAGTAPLVPYLSTYARQLGFSPATVGLIYTILPIFGLFAKPLFGFLADKFRAQKNIFLMFIVVTILSFSTIYFVPQEMDKIPVEMYCNNNLSTLQTCYPPNKPVDQCKIDHIADMNSTMCKMTCNMTSFDLRKPVCEQPSMPTLCFKNINANGYDALISNVSVSNECITIATHTIDLGHGLLYESRCRNEDLKEPCYLECNHPTLSAMTYKTEVNMTCVEQRLSYEVCNNDSFALLDSLDTKDELGKCKVHCNSATSVSIMDLCDMWNAGITNNCELLEEDTLPNELQFQAALGLTQMIVDRNNCLFIDVKYIVLENGTIVHPTCGPTDYHERRPHLYQPQCIINCDDSMVNEIFKAAIEDTEEETQYNLIFWMFFISMIVSWIGQAVVVTFADAICFNILGCRASLYGRQRLWGSFGFGCISLLTGFLIDTFSEGAYKNYTIAFILMLIFLSGDFIVSSFMKVEQSQMSINIMADVGTMLSSYANILFLLWTVAVGLCTGLIWQFLFWHIEDIANLTCDGTEYVKTLQGLVSAIQTFGGEIPFMFISGYLLKKFGHSQIMSAVLFGFGIRFILYSHIISAWWILPVELFQGLTSGMFYPTITSYANIVSAPGTETTVQGLVGAIFEGVGSSLGSFIGGRLYGVYGGWITFRYFGYGALVAGVIHAVATAFVKKGTHMGLTPGNNRG